MSIVDFVLFFIVTYIIGFITAIPIGATQFEIAKRAVSGYIKEALMVVAGSVLSDVSYGFIGMFGIAPFLKDKKVEAFFWLVGGTILLILGVFTLIYNKMDPEEKVEKPSMFKVHASFLVGFSLAVTNPPIAFWWVLCFDFVKDLSIVPNLGALTSVLFVLIGGVGIASYLTSLALFLKKVGKNITKKMEYRMNRIMGILLIMLSLYFLIKTLEFSLK